MSYVRDNDYKQVTLPTDSNYWVKLDTDLTYKDIKRLGEGTDGIEASDKFLQLAIKEWNLDGVDGKVLDLTPENIDLLRKDDVMLIINTLRDEVEGTAEKKESSPSK